MEAGSWDTRISCPRLPDVICRKLAVDFCVGNQLSWPLVLSWRFVSCFSRCSCSGFCPVQCRVEGVRGGCGLEGNRWEEPGLQVTVLFAARRLVCISQLDTGLFL